MNNDYEDVLEQILHDLGLCKSRDDIHENDEFSGMKLSDKIRTLLDIQGYAILEKYLDE